jgi:GNAT superfamily N-acetyltransferase
MQRGVNQTIAATAEAAGYLAHDVLRNGLPIEIRALSAADRDALIAAAKRMSPASRFFRFFVAKNKFTEREIAFFTNADFIDHVALVACLSEKGRPAIVGGARYVVVAPGRAEVAFSVVDGYQRLGIGAVLLRHLAILGRRAGITQFVAEVLADNKPMLSVFSKSGLAVETRREPGVVHVSVAL